MKSPVFPAAGALVAATGLFLASEAKAANLVQNGDFESSSPINLPTYQNPTGIGQIDVAATLPFWVKECLLNCSQTQTSLNSEGFAFVVDDKAATRPNGGFPSKFFPNEGNTYFWGPDNTISTFGNGFRGSTNGGKFVAIDGDFGRSSLSQEINGLDTTKTYTLSFEYAGAQQGLNTIDFTGATTQKWIVEGVGSGALETPTWINPSKGFTDWKVFSTPFTPTSSTINLKFTPFGAVVGGMPTGMDSLPPFLLLDNVQILEGNTPPPNPPSGQTGVPGPLPILGAGIAYFFFP
jgi:hypothetical protein